MISASPVSTPEAGTAAINSLDHARGPGLSPQAVIHKGRLIDGNRPITDHSSAPQDSAIPIRFSLGGDQGLSILAQGYPTTSSTACSSSGGVDAIEEVITASNSGLSYDANADQYTYVWKTDKTWGGACCLLVLRLSDGTDHKAAFHFTR